MPFKKNLVFPPVYTHIHTHPFNGPFSGTTQVSWYQKGKTNLDFTETRDSEWQWHQLGHMQVCTSLQTDDHAIIPPLSFFTGRMPFLPPNQQRQSTEGNNILTHLNRISIQQPTFHWAIAMSPRMSPLSWAVAGVTKGGAEGTVAPARCRRGREGAQRRLTEIIFWLTNTEVSMIKFESKAAYRNDHIFVANLFRH